MTGLSDLPPELLLKIARHFRSTQSPPERAVYGYQNSPDAKDTKQKLHLSARSLLSLSSTCRAFKSVLEPERYYLITNFNLPGSSTAHKLLYLLALVHERPQIRWWIKQLHLFLSGLASTDTFSLEAVHIRFLRRKALALGGDKLERTLMEEVENGKQRPLYKTVLAILAISLLRILDNASGISMIFTTNFFKRVVGVLGHGQAGLTLRGQDPPQNIFLPKLTSFAIAIDSSWFFRKGDERDTWSKSLVDDWKKAGAVTYAPLLSELVLIEDLPQCFPFYRLPETRCKSLRSITLHEVFIPAEELKYLLARCERLETFKYYISYPPSSWDDEPDLAPSPRDVQDAVGAHAASLHTLCFVAPEWSWTRDEGFRSLKDLVSLENLVVDPKSFPLRSIRSRSLPKSLRRLHISGRHRRMAEYLYNFATRFTRNRLPVLEEVAFDDGCICMPDEAYLDDLNEEFRRIGVRHLNLDPFDVL